MKAPQIPVELDLIEESEFQEIESSENINLYL